VTIAASAYEDHVIFIKAEKIKLANKLFLK